MELKEKGGKTGLQRGTIMLELPEGKSMSGRREKGEPA